MTDLKIYNGFGIVPTSNCEAAGLDFYVPNNTGLDKKDIILNAFSKSYKLPVDAIADICDQLVYYTISSHPFAEDEANVEKVYDNALNILQLYLCIKSAELLGTDVESNSRISAFVDDYLIFDDNAIPGIKVYTNDAVLINTGIKVALDTDTAGIFFNKSGRGNNGWDVRAQVVDEDYAGYVHLSLAYTQWTTGVFYCGDKLSQMVILPIIHKNCVAVDSEEDYNKLMDNSKRGSNSFGSSDEKH